MANFEFNVAKGKTNAYYDRVANQDPATSAIVIVLLKAAEADATLEDYDDLATLLAAAGNTEADFTDGVTPYARKVLDHTAISATTPDDTANTQSATFANQTWVDAGGTTDNTLVKLVVCYDPNDAGGTDSEIIPLTCHDFATTTNGNDLTAVVDAAGVFTAS